MKILDKERYHILDRRYLATNIHSNLYQNDFDYSELESQVVDTVRVYKQLVDFLSANQNRNGGACTATLSDLLNVVKKPNGFDDEIFIGMLTSAIRFYELADGQRRLADFDIKLHRSFQMHIRKCAELTEIKDANTLLALNKKHGQKWTQAFEIKFFENGSIYTFGVNVPFDKTDGKLYFVIRPKLTKFANSADFKWELVVKTLHKCGEKEDKRYSYDINHIDMDYTPRKVYHRKNR
jgi:hypothetical protein